MTLNCNGELIDLSSPKIMGILNLTPDSFYDGGKYTSDQKILNQVAQMLHDGATFIDLGGYSSRPQADHITETMEAKRVLPAVALIRKHFPEALISVDTFRSGIARACVNAGATLINDISAGQIDPDMLPTVAALGVPYIAMHMQGTPQSMQQHTHYADLLKSIIYYFSERIAAAQALGIADMIIDPGFGFSKTVAQNYELLNKLDLLKMIDKPILIGVSRKSMIYKTLNTTPQDALNGTSVLHTIGIQKGAHILRVHDVKEAKECLLLMEALNKK